MAGLLVGGHRRLVEELFDRDAEESSEGERRFQTWPNPAFLDVDVLLARQANPYGDGLLTQACRCAVTAEVCHVVYSGRVKKRCQGGR